KDGERGGDQRELVYGDSHQIVRGAHVEQVAGDCHLTVGARDGKDSGGCLNVWVEKDRKQEVARDDQLRDKQHRYVSVDKQLMLTAGTRVVGIDGDDERTVGGTRRDRVKGNAHEHVEGYQRHHVQGDYSSSVQECVEEVRGSASRRIRGDHHEATQ